MSSEDDETKKAELWKRVQKLEETVYPGRRDVLKAGLGIAALGGAGGTGYALGKSETSRYNFDFESINSERINRVYWLNPDVSDFGEAVNDAVSEMSNGDILRVPPVEYSNSTTAQIDKNISIIGDGEGVGSHYHNPVIEKKTDNTVIEVAGQDLSVWLVGLRIDGLGSNDTTPAIDAKSRVKIDRVTGDNHGDHLIKLSSPNPNHNHSRITNVGSNRLEGGSIVYIDGESYGIDVHVRMSSQAEYAIDINHPNANGCRAWVQSCYNNDSGVIRLAGSRCHGYVQKEQTTPNTIVFDNNGNVGEVLNSSSNPFVDNSSDPSSNRKINHQFGKHFPGALTAQDSLIVESATRVDVGPQSYQTVFDVNEATEIVGGTIYGHKIGWRLTIDGTIVVDDDNSAVGQDQSGDNFSPVAIPPARSTQSMHLEVYNCAQSSDKFGWRVYKR